MGKNTDLEKQVERTSGGHEMGGSKFGQTAGEANHESRDRGGDGKKPADRQTEERKSGGGNEAGQRPDPGRTPNQGMRPVERESPPGRGERAS